MPPKSNSVFLSGKMIVNGEVEIVDEVLANCKPVINIIDKDLTNIALLEAFIPDSTIILCTFHVMKWFKTLLNSKDILDGTKLAVKS